MKKVIRILLCLYVFFIFETIITNMDYTFLNKENRFFYGQLEKRMNKGEKEIYLKDLTNFIWEKGFYISSYNEIDIKNREVFELGDQGARYIKYGKGYEYAGNLPRLGWAWVFVRGNKIIAIIKSKRKWIKENWGNENFDHKSIFIIREQKKEANGIVYQKFLIREKR
jgi:hypothetical protein